MPRSVDLSGNFDKDDPLRRCGSPKGVLKWCFLVLVCGGEEDWDLKFAVNFRSNGSKHDIVRVFCWPSVSKIIFGIFSN